MDSHPGTLDSLLALAARDEAEGLGDAPWPPHFAKQAGEPSRVQPSKAKSSKSFGSQMEEGFGAQRFRRQAKKIQEGDASTSEAAPTKPATRKPRASSKPLHIIAQSPDKPAAEAGLTRWKAAHPEAAEHLQEADILVDRMRGSAYVWYRIRVNLEHIPEALRPPQEAIDPDDDPTRKWREGEPEA
jgi:hypothetical protein